jgi:superfamily II DNA or RNA helicase
MAAKTNDHENASELASRLEEMQKENSRLRQENLRLKKILMSQGFSTGSSSPTRSTAPIVPTETVETKPAQVHSKSSAKETLSPGEKVALFRSMFRGREDVYAERWESKSGKSGYSPAEPKEWEMTPSGGFRLKRPDRHIRELFPLTDQVIRDHLSGKRTVGVYPLLSDETCWFLTVDFDKKTWQQDCRVFLETCQKLGVPAALERSRSGKGGHIWIFFDRPVSAAIARKMGCAVLTKTMEQRHEVGLDSYDRLFPSQDTMPKGGFGNLIALPLQAGPRKNGNTVFLNGDFVPYQDQWAFLSSVKRMQLDEVEALVREAVRDGQVLGARAPVTGEHDGSRPWEMPGAEMPITEPLPEKVRLVRANMLYVEKDGLPQSLLNRLIRLAAFQNPEFYKAQAMRLSTFAKPRLISCAMEFQDHVGLPRGCLDEVLAFLKFHGIKFEVVDERFAGKHLDVNFTGQLRPMQQMAAASIAPCEDGVLCAPTAFGKTALAAWVVAERKVNTLVLVHRRVLMDQWRQQLALFLNLPVSAIGQIGGGKSSRTGDLDVAIIQSLSQAGAIKEFVAEYGQVIVDECHHVSAFSFEQVLRQARARYVLGLTATPLRKDGHHPIITMQCGPIRYNPSVTKLSEFSALQHVVRPRYTDFSMPIEAVGAGIQEVYQALTQDQRRNEQIAMDVLETLSQGRSPLLLTERTDHAQWFVDRLATEVPSLFHFRGGMGKKQRMMLIDQLQSLPEDACRVIVATGRYIGEGFDDARLDTLFLAMPVSWKGTLQQYVGRLHRLHDNKRVVQVYDYVDIRVAMLARMFDKRMRGYKSIGYVLEAQENV